MAAGYPVKAKQAAGLVDGVHTEVNSTYFSDKILVTITQNGRLAQWIQVPLESVSIPSSNSSLPAGAASNELLPMSHLTPRTLLGGSTSTRETVGQLYATQIASVIATKDPQEKRTIVLGLGLGQVEASRTMFYDTIELVLKCL